MNIKKSFPKHLLQIKNNPSDMTFQDMYKAKEQQPKQQEKEMDWISVETYNLFFWKAMACKQGQPRNAQRLNLLLKRRLQQDCQNQITQVETKATTTFAQHV
jgi:hypothetical protein